jgi:hypothetical protein
MVSRLTLTRSRPRIERGDGAHDVDERASQQGLAPGQAHLRDAIAHEEPDDAHELLVGEHVGLGQPWQPLGRHAVGAAQVAPVGDRDPQVAGDPPELVGQPREAGRARRLGRPDRGVGEANHVSHSKPGTVKACFDSG